MENKIQRWQMVSRQKLPLWMKEELTSNRIRAWYEYWNGEVYISFSGGKDSTVLLYQVRKLYPNVKAVFVDTGLEYPEIRDFVKTIDNVEWIKPKYTFKEILDKYGFPVVSKGVSQKITEAKTTKSAKLLYKRLHGDNNAYKSGKIPNKWQYLIQSPFKISHKCCHYLKEQPLQSFEKQSGMKSFIGLMANDSLARMQKLLKGGCNAFETKKQQSNPIAFWLEQDIWKYIKKYELPYSKIYDMGYKRTGCMFCMFGVHLEKGQNRFQRMSQTHPKQYNFCINKLGLGEVLDYIGIDYKKYTPSIDDMIKNIQQY